MYKIEVTDYGVKLTFDGFIKQAEMSQWVTESENIVKTLSPGFGVFVDMRGLKPLPQDAEAEMQKGQKLYKECGMTRSVVILANATTTMQFKRIAKETGIYEWERYINASKVDDWEQQGIKWLTDAEDPDL